MARSFAGDKKQMVPLLKAALKHKGTSVLDIISPCVTFNDFDGSTKSWDWAKEHEEPLQDVGFVPRLPEIEVEQKPGETTRVQLHDGSWITLKALHHEEHDVTSKVSALQLLEESQRKERVPDRPDLRRRQAEGFLDESARWWRHRWRFCRMRRCGRRRRFSRKSWRRSDNVTLPAHATWRSPWWQPPSPVPAPWRVLTRSASFDVALFVLCPKGAPENSQGLPAPGS